MRVGLLQWMNELRKGCRRVSVGGTRGKEIIGPRMALVTRAALGIGV